MICVNCWQSSLISHSKWVCNCVSKCVDFFKTTLFDHSLNLTQYFDWIVWSIGYFWNYRKAINIYTSLKCVVVVFFLLLTFCAKNRRFMEKITYSEGVVFIPMEFTWTSFVVYRYIDTLSDNSDGDKHEKRIECDFYQWKVESDDRMQHGLSSSQQNLIIRSYADSWQNIMPRG